VRKVHTGHVEEMVEKLFEMVKTGKDEERDISSIALKTVLAEVPQSAAGTTVRKLTPRLLQEGLAPNAAMDVTIRCLEILHDLLQHFPSLLANDLPTIKGKLLPELASLRAPIRKRAVTCVGALCVCLSDSLFVQVVEHLLEQVGAGAAKPSDVTLTTYIQTICAIARGSGFRLGTSLGRIVPLLIECASHAQGTSDAGTEVAEHCLQASEALVARCPSEITPFIPQLLELGLLYLKYDPNYAADEDGEDEAQEMSGVEDEDEDDFGGEYSDDDDTSWKVRRAAAKLLAALISAKPDAVPSVFSQLCPALLSRFGEREESVLADLFATVRLLIQCTANPRSGAALQPLLRAELPEMVKVLSRSLKSRSLKTRSGGFVLLRELTCAVPGGLSAHVNVLVPAVEKALRDKTSSSPLKMEVLGFLRLLLDSHPPDVLHAHLSTLTPPVLACVSDRYYKICAEALRVCGAIAVTLRPSPPAPSPLALGAYVPPIFEAVAARLRALDQDQEVKEASITTMGTLVATVGDELKTQLPAAMAVMLERLRNEITRLTAVRAFEAIASSPLELPLAETISPLLSELCSFLRKNNRSLRQASLLTLHALTLRHAAALGADGMREMVVEVAPIISDKDLQLTASALSLCISLVEAEPAKMGPLIGEQILPPVLSLLLSPLLQGVAVARAQALLRALVASGAAAFGFEKVLQRLVAAAGSADGSATGSKQGLHSIALCVAALCEAAPAEQRQAALMQFMSGITSRDLGAQLLALHCLGQIGRRIDLSAQQATLLPALTATFDAPAEELKSAGACALGGIASGAVSCFLPRIVAQVGDPAQAAHHYLLLHALKELILSADAVLLEPHVVQVLPLLFAQAEGAPDESLRTVVAECLGKLLAAAPATVLPALRARLTHEAAPMRAIAVTSLRFAIVDTPSPLDALLPAAIGDFLGTLSDADHKTRLAALLTLSCIAHNQPSYVSECLPALLPHLYSETVKKAELVHQVDLGPFKHTVDDGLQLRKAAFECMDTLLDSCADRLELKAFIARLAEGLADEYDIKMLCHLVLCKMVSRAAGERGGGAGRERGQGRPLA
jgi:cullin-associated NEDD8-dissociated protein 1